ncbi:hypothetical protein RJ639_010378 [Escallonia herrerae]|uniref:Integrase catalytic domain-containing protein n=1 Tax=Escallonia herrerae TaxID=1293975 RepID=A0AA88VW98_9ASTE|nr:hypothetical protein RJ639_010378 [Escallonia herrerae]
MDKEKVKAIKEWEAPTKVSELRSFLGLANYYRRFIKGYSAKAAPLTDLLKKGKAWEWSKRYQTAFKGLKEVVTEEPVLALPDHTKVFELQTDASDFAIGGVLMQEGHPIAFESRKLNDTEQRYTVQEKEMTAVVHCLRTWRHYLLGSRFLIKTDNIATSYFQSQRKLSPKQARWQDFLAEFNYYATFVASPADCTAEEAARLFLKNVVKYWGLPKVIVSDRDPRFTGKFWTELFKLLGSELHFSTSFHPQTNAQTERVNALLECYLRHFVSANQTDWVRLLDVAQFSYNLIRSETTDQSPFEIAIGQQPLAPLTLVGDYKGKSPLAVQVARSWNEQADVERSYLDKAGRKMKKWADKRRRQKEYNLGDMVMLKLLPQQFKSFRKVHKGLIQKYEGPFPIVAKVGKASYRLELPPKLKIHPVFHLDGERVEESATFSVNRTNRSSMISTPKCSTSSPPQAALKCDMNIWMLGAVSFVTGARPDGSNFTISKHPFLFIRFSNSCGVGL